MLWPNVIESLKAQIVAVVEASDYAGTPVWLGASTRVPNDDGIYVIPSNRKPIDSMCDREQMTAYVEIWTKPVAPETGNDGVEMENDHVFVSWDKLAKLDRLLAEHNFNDGFTCDHVETTGDGGAFHPVSGCRLQFKLTYGVSNDG